MAEGLISWSAPVAFYHTGGTQPHFIDSQTLPKEAVTYSMPCDLAGHTYWQQEYCVESCE